MILDTGRNTSFLENRREISHIFRFVSVTKHRTVHSTTRRGMKTFLELLKEVSPLNLKFLLNLGKPHYHLYKTTSGKNVHHLDFKLYGAKSRKDGLVFKIKYKPLIVANSNLDQGTVKGFFAHKLSAGITENLMKHSSYYREALGNNLPKEGILWNHFLSTKPGIIVYEQGPVKSQESQDLSLLTHEPLTNTLEYVATSIKYLKNPLNVEIQESFRDTKAFAASRKFAFEKVLGKLAFEEKQTLDSFFFIDYSFSGLGIVPVKGQELPTNLKDALLEGSSEKFKTKGLLFLFHSASNTSFRNTDGSIRYDVVEHIINSNQLSDLDDAGLITIGVEEGLYQFLEERAFKLAKVSQDGSVSEEIKINIVKDFLHDITQTALPQGVYFSLADSEYETPG